MKQTAKSSETTMALDSAIQKLTEARQATDQAVYALHDAQKFAGLAGVFMDPIEARDLIMEGARAVTPFRHRLMKLRGSIVEDPAPHFDQLKSKPKRPVKKAGGK